MLKMTRTLLLWVTALQCIPCARAGEPGPMRQLTPSSRRSPLIFSEIMYHPLDRADGKDLEFVEVFNTEPVDWDIGGFRLEGEIDYTFPAGTVLAGRSFVVVAADPASLEGQYGLAGVCGPYQGRLSNGGGALRLVNHRGGVLLEVEYDDHEPWPESPDGLGHSLVLIRPDYGEGDPLAWEASAARGGNPGAADPGTDQRICINEILAHPGTGQTAFIELFNASGGQADLSGWVLSDGSETPGFRIPEATFLPAGGTVAFWASHWGGALSLNPGGGRVALVSADGRRVMDAVTYGAEEPGMPLGRFPNGAYGLRALAGPTPGSVNLALRDRDVVINEIMYHPISEDRADEYLELHNKGTRAVDVGAWVVDGAVRYTIPAGTVIAAGGYLVVAADAGRMIGRYANLTAANTVGDFSGQLDNRGERIQLFKPTVASPTDTRLVLMDEVAYGDGGNWGRWTDGGGSSLELKDPHSDNSRPGNWAGSDETAKAPWTTFSHTGTLDLGSGTCDEFEVLLLESGECLVDDMVIQKGGTAQNRAKNGNLESGQTGWITEGNHSGSVVENGRGVGGSRGMHVVATGDGDNLPNCLRQGLTSKLNSGDTATLSAKARWLRGNRNLLLRLHGNYLEAVGTLDLPDNLGTPGLPNSTATDNAGPVIEEVNHGPVLPESGQAVTVTARVHDPDGVSTVTLYYRIDGSAFSGSVLMQDSGGGGDRVADDGLFTAVLPGRPAGTLIAFTILAKDGAVPPALSAFPEGGSEALIRVGDRVAPGVFGNYKIWLTAANSAAWSSWPKMSNEVIGCTFVYGDFRVVHNAGIRMRGSGWIRPRFSDPFDWIASYIVKVDKADRVLGSTSLNLDNLKQQDVWGRGVLDPTYLRERMSFWIGEQLGVETCYQRFVLLDLNGVRKGVVFTDTQHPNQDYLRCWFPNDDNGHSFEVDSWFEYDNGSPGYKGNATLERFTTTGGVLKQARYRWNWEKKVAHAADDDYAPFLELVEVMNSSSDYYTKVDALVDWDQWMRGFAVRRGAAADRDGYGYEAGKNAFVYKGEGTRWKYLLWDLDLGFGIERGYNHGLFAEIGDPVLRDRFFQEPAFRRAYWRALQDLVDGPMAPDRFDPIADAYSHAFRDNGIVTDDATAVKEWVRDRRGYILSQLDSVGAEFSVTTHNGSPFSSAASPCTVQGTAPVKVDAILVNGSEVPVAWTDVTTWSIDVDLAPGQNTLVFEGYDSSSKVLPGMQDSIRVTYTGP